VSYSIIPTHHKSTVDEAHERPSKAKQKAITAFLRLQSKSLTQKLSDLEEKEQLHFLLLYSQMIKDCIRGNCWLLLFSKSQVKENNHDIKSKDTSKIYKLC